MWILNQQQTELIKASYIFITSSKKANPSTGEILNNNTIYCNNDKGIIIDLGVYESKDRCKDIIRDITQSIAIKERYYSMPEV